VIVGTNGAGKSSLFEFLRFLRDSAYAEIPPEIVTGAVGQQIFHSPGPERFQWQLEIDVNKEVPIVYFGELTGPTGRTRVTAERVESARPFGKHTKNYLYMNMAGSTGIIQGGDGFHKQDLRLSRPNQLALSTITNPGMTILYGLREYVQNWRFYSAFNISNEKVRRSVPVQQDPTLREDTGNLSAVLHYLMTEHRPVFEELQQHLRSVVPGFKYLNVKARGGPGEVIAFWSEKGVDDELSLADLSDGSLRLLCWLTLCMMPTPPTLLCIDELDQGVHLRTLPLLAGLMKKAADRTQILLATHASYFLLQFELDDLAVIRKKDGAAEFVKPGNSKILQDNLEDFGVEEIEAMHRGDKFETFA
jgi:predicted ATPase